MANMSDKEFYQRVDRYVGQVSRIAILTRVFLWLGIIGAIGWALSRAAP